VEVREPIELSFCMVSGVGPRLPILLSIPKIGRRAQSLSEWMVREPLKDHQQWQHWNRSHIP